MVGWLISVPVWGDDYVRTFVDYAVPALKAALEPMGDSLPVRFLIHTDRPLVVQRALSDYKVEVRVIAPGAPYTTLQYSHQEAVERASVGERVALLNADLVISRNLFTSCNAHFDAGVEAIVTSGIRTNMDPAFPPPIGADSADLLNWAWEHRHRIIKDLEWDSGESMIPTNLFFVSGYSVVLHGFHLHPVAILKTQYISFQSTIDGDLLDSFDTERIHVVTDPYDLSMLEMSPPHRRFPVRGVKMTPSLVVSAMATRASLRHCWLFHHRMLVRGTLTDVNEMPIVDEILKRMTNNTFVRNGKLRGRVPAGRPPRIAPAGPRPVGRR